MITMTRDDVLVDASWLVEHLHDDGLRIVEIDVSPAAYNAGHIPGALLWNVYSDLKDANYQLLDKSAFSQLLSRSGIDADSTVVFYGYAPAMGVWLMKLYGHVDARVLDCARDVWENDGLPWDDEVPAPTPTLYALPDEDPRLRARAFDVERAITDSTRQLIDVRSENEYVGERFWPSGGMEEGGRAGHVPGARRLSIDDVRDARGGFASAAELRAIFGPTDDRRLIITYCTIGGRACTAWFALTYLLGRDNVQVYDGSWAEWGRLPSSPVEVGQGGIAMARLVRKSLETPEEVRPFEDGMGQLVLVNLDDGPIGRATFMPGWRWSEHVKPIAKTDSCQAAHMGYFVSGRMKVVTDDGEELEFGPGDFAIMEPGHDAWTVGDVPCVVIDWQGFADYAKRR